MIVNLVLSMILVSISNVIAGDILKSDIMVQSKSKLPLNGLEMVAIPAGCFQMGSPNFEAFRENDENPQHEVCVQAFWMSKYELTQQQWQSVMGSNPSYFVCDNCPVERVSWSDVQVYLAKLKSLSGKAYRLPTEAEWEYACRGGDNTLYCGGNDPKIVGWSIVNSGNKTHAVGQKMANKFGLFDMSGNIWEWTCSSYVNMYDGNEKKCVNTNFTNGSIVFRGGSWFLFPGGLRLSNRDNGPISYRNINLGFRLVYDF